MKITRILSIFLSLLLVSAILPMRALAADGIIISEVSFAPYEDPYGAQYDDIINVRVVFTAPESMNQMTILLMGADMKTITMENKHQIIYQNQIETPEDGVLVFPVEKARILSATGRDKIDGAKLYLRIGGTGMATVSKTVSYKEPVVGYGDLNADGEIDIADAILILRYHAQLGTLSVEQLKAADVTQDGEVDNADALRILLFEAGMVDTILKTS